MRQSQYRGQPAPDSRKTTCNSGFLSKVPRQIKPKLASICSIGWEIVWVKNHSPAKRSAPAVGRNTPRGAEAAAPRRGQKSAGAFVDQERHAELGDGFVKRVVIDVVDIAAF